MQNEIPWGALGKKSCIQLKSPRAKERKLKIFEAFFGVGPATNAAPKGVKNSIKVN